MGRTGPRLAGARAITASNIVSLIMNIVVIVLLTAVK
jgi:hypothetical protein